MQTFATITIDFLKYGLVEEVCEPQTRLVRDAQHVVLARQALSGREGHHSLREGNRYHGVPQRQYLGPGRSLRGDTQQF